MDSSEHVSIGYFSYARIGKFHSQTFSAMIELGLKSSMFGCFHLEVDLEDVYLELLELEKFIHDALTQN